MMKKFNIVIMFALMLTMTACGGTPPANSGQSSSAAAMQVPAPATSAAAAASHAPAPANPAADGDVGGAHAERPNDYYEARPGHGESYLVIDENKSVLTDVESTLTFSLKVDTAAYTNVARYIRSGNRPPRDAVRTEEMINYFTYEGNMAFTDDSPFALYAEIGPSPLNPERHMAFLRVKSKDIDRSELPPCNLTFLIDTSGSMDSYDKLPLLQDAFGLLAETLGENDRVSIVTYAGSSGVVLDGASGADKERILSAINNLNAGGSTAGAEGIMTAYALAEKNFRINGNNRIILATDGDFNVGTSNTDELARLVGEKRGNGIYMSVLGFGTGNIRDDIMETLSKEGNGNYAYIGDVYAARKVLVDELAANLYTIADDVKAQVEFNPRNVKSYRLIGYENRRLNNEDFTDDTKDAGEVGVGADVIMMFELELYGDALAGGKKYAPRAETPDFADELFEVRIRYKNPGTSQSRLITQPAYLSDMSAANSSDYNFACAVAAFGHMLRDSAYQGGADFDSIYDLAQDGLGRDEQGYRRDFLRLMEEYRRIW